MDKLTNQHKTELSLFINEKDRTLEEIKKAQVILLLSEGISELVVQSLTGLRKKTIVKTRKKYIKNGLDVLVSKRKKKKPASLLTKNQRAEISNMLHTKTPRNYGWDWDYWTPSILGKLILELYGVKYKSKTSLYIIFKQSKFTYHKPEKIYQRRNQDAIDKWKKENDVIVKKALSDPKTVVLVEDEMIITSQTTLQKIWLPENDQHKIECSNTRKRRSIYGFLNIKIGKQMAFKSEKQTSEIAAKFLHKVLNTYKGKKVLLFWDNAPWHKGDAMKKFLDTCTNFLIINFPTYSPDKNPQEQLWKAGRTNVTHNTFVLDIDKTMRELLSYLNNSIFKYEFFGFTAS